MGYDYNQISQLYDDVREADFKIVEFMMAKAQINEASRVLEIGCGTGNYLRLIQQLTKAEIWGLDSSQGMLGKAREKCENATLIEGDAVKLENIPAASFDLVYMVDVIHHIKNIDGMFESIKRVLKSNAPVVIFSDSYEHIKNRLTSKYFPETVEAELKRYPDTKDIIHSLRTNAFYDMEDGVIELYEEQDFGPKLIEIASKKGYSMFGLISEETIKAGIARIEADSLIEPIKRLHKAPYVMAVK